MPLCAHAACSAGNGDAIPGPVYDAAGLDVGNNPGDPDGGNGGPDGSQPDSSVADSPSDSPKESGPNTAPVQINELYVDRIGDGDGSEFVELRAAPGTPMDDLKLRVVYANGLVKYEVTAGMPGDKVGPGGLWVVGGSQTFRLNVTDRVDRTVSISVWGLDLPGAVQVVRGTTLLDVVGYSAMVDAGALPPLSSPPTATSEGTPAIAPDNAGISGSMKRISFGRKTGAADTNNNADDFCAMEASPGFAQKPCK